MDNIVRSFATDLLRHRRYNYSQEPLEDFLMVHPSMHCQQFRIPNAQGHLLETILLRRMQSSACILYAHGLGSNKLEALSIAKHFTKQGYDVCSFDFSASGRSEGDHITYGINEKEDVLAVLRHLEATEQYSRIVLWGRSMGAVAVVLSQEQEENSKVDCLVLDSPFSSF
jgi:alpha-beta hydrolase superfamily lysophospholipase